MLLVMIITTAVGGLIRAFTGFGSGLLLAPVFSFYLAPHDMLAVVVLINMIGTLQMLPGVWRDIDWPLIWRMVPPAVVGVPIGWMVLNVLDPEMVRRLVAAIVVVLSLVLLSGWIYRGARGRLQDILAGVSSGTLTGIAAIGGPPFILYMMSAPGYSPAAFRTFFTVYFAFTQVVVLGVMFYNGALSTDQLVYTGTMLPFYMLATALGTFLFFRALQGHAHHIKRISLLLLLAVGVVILVL